MTTSNLDQLEELARRKSAGELTDEQFAAEKQRLLNPDAITPEEADAIAKSIGLTIIGLALIFVGSLIVRYNGWAIEHAAGLYGLGSDSGLFIGNYHSAPAVFIKFGSGWVGIARTNDRSLLFDSPVLNIALLVVGCALIIEGFKWIFSSKTEPDKEQTEPG